MGCWKGVKPIPGQSGYFADDKGNIYSNKAKGGKLRVLKPCCHKKTDRHLSIMFSGDRKRYFVHRIIYETFNGTIPKGMLVCHKNDDAQDNRIQNLYLGTHLDNARDAMKNNKKPIGENCSFSKLKEKEVSEILYLKGKFRNSDIARMYGVNKCTITDIYKNRTWKHIKRSV